MVFIKNDKIVAMQAQKKPRFSVVIPCYNEEAYIGETLDSLIGQDFKEPYEIIVVDNNCTDRTAEIAKSYKNVKVVKQKNPGVVWARQAGTENASGEIVISSDADTTFESTWLSQSDAQYKKSDKIIAVCGPCEFVNDPSWGSLSCYLLFNGVYHFQKILGRPNYITATNTSFKKSVWQGYNTNLTQGGDEFGLLLKLKKQPGKIIFTRDYKVYTSSRRLEKGLAYNLFVSSLFYYFLAYYVDRIFQRPVIGHAPAYRPYTTALTIAKLLKTRSEKYTKLVDIRTFKKS